MTEWHNAQLGEIVAELESKLTPQNKANYEKLVVAGQRAALANGPGGILFALGRRENVVLTAVRGAINIVGVLKNITKGAPPQPAAMIPATYTLLMYALDFAEKAKLITVDQQVIGQATRLWMNNVMHGFGIQPRQLQTMGTAVENVTKDDAKMDAIHRYVGYVKDPRIPSKTLPDDDVTPAEKEKVEDGV